MRGGAGWPTALRLRAGFRLPAPRPDDCVVIASAGFADDPRLSFEATSEHPHLVNAPIREALIDFRVRLPPAFSPETLLALTEELSAQYPFRRRGNLRRSSVYRR